MMVIEIWLLGGPADGGLMPVEADDPEHLPTAIDLPQSGVYVGSSDVPAAAVSHRSLLEDASEEPIIYRRSGVGPIGTGW